MCACSLQLIGCERLVKNIIGSSIELQVTTEYTDLSASLNNQKIRNLWQQFMTKNYCKLKYYCVDENIISLQEPIGKNNVRKWAAVEIVSNRRCSFQADDLKKLTINGDYFGFVHIGTAVQFDQTYQEAIDYLRDKNIQIDENQFRLEIMHRNYLPNDPLSKEEFWIPIII